MKQAVVHQNLARVFTHKSFGAPAQRAYALWSVLRPDGQTWYFYNDIVEMYTQKSGKRPETVRGWIKTGVDMNLFKLGHYYDGRPTLSIVGRDWVQLHYLDGIAPGKAILIDAELLLTASLQRLRSILFHTFCAERPVFRSRNFTAGTIDRVEQTTRNYSHSTKQPKRYTYIKQTVGPNRQTSNLWTPSNMYKTRTKFCGKIRHRYKPWRKPKRAKKLYYYNRDTAVNVSHQRAKAGEDSVVMWILPDSAVDKTVKAKVFGHVFLEPVYCL